VKTVRTFLYDIETQIDFRIRKKYHLISIKVLSLTALGIAPFETYQTTLLIDQVSTGAIATLLAGLIAGAIGNITFKCSLYSIFPGVDRFTVKFESLYEIEDIDDGHTIADNTRYELGVVPELFVEHMRDTSKYTRITKTVNIVKIIPGLTALEILFLDNPTLFNGSGNDTGIFVYNTGENLIRLSV